MRDEFEVWFYEELSVAGGVYHLAWQSWQAAIASVVVELPDWSEYDTPRQAIDATKERLDSAGITWTE